MVFTRNKIQQNKKLFSQLDESDADFMIALFRFETQAEIRTNLAEQR